MGNWRSWKIWVSIFGAAAILVGVLFATPVLGPGASAVGADFYLWAGQTNLAGTGTVENDCTNLSFHIEPECGINEIHIGVFDVEPNQPGDVNPPPGGLGYSDVYATPKTSGFDIVVPWTTLGYDPNNCPDDIWIAIHAVVGGGFYDCEPDTAWACSSNTPGGCLRFGGDTPGNWAAYFAYACTECND